MSETCSPVYVVDDDESMRESVGSLIRSAGLRVETLASAQEFLARPRSELPSCLVLDVKLPGLSGLDLQQELARADVHIPIIFLSGSSDVPMSVRAMKAGALEFLTKPFDDEVLLDAIRRGISRHQKRRLAAEKALGHSIVGDGPAMRRLLEVVSRVASKDITVLISGETGTGKELAASLLHAQSRRAARARTAPPRPAFPGWRRS
jgi:DNA-binding NtrC family response regulator